MRAWLIIIGFVVLSTLGIVGLTYFGLKYGSMKKRSKRIIKYTRN